MMQPRPNPTKNAIGISRNISLDEMNISSTKDEFILNRNVVDI